MLVWMIRLVYGVAAAIVAGGTGLYVLLHDVSPTLLIPGIFGGVGIVLVGSGAVALLRGRVRIRGGWLERESAPLLYWLFLLGGHYGMGAWMLKVSWDQFRIAAEFLGG
jgi:hypothetical protein